MIVQVSDSCTVGMKAYVGKHQCNDRHPDRKVSLPLRILILQALALLYAPGTCALDVAVGGRHRDVPLQGKSFSLALQDPGFVSCFSVEVLHSA